MALLPWHGLKESREITEQLLQKIGKGFPREKGVMLSWGSTARREMGPLSDVDLLFLSDGVANKIRMVNFTSELESAMKPHRLDLLKLHELVDLKRSASIDSTDRQAVFLSRAEGEESIPEDFSILKRQLKRDGRCNLKEAMHSLLNLELVFPKRFGKNNLKFSKGFLKDFGFAFFFANMINSDDRCIEDTSTALRFLGERGIIKRDEGDSYVTILNNVIFLRNRAQEISVSENAIVDEKFIKKIEASHGISRKQIIQSMSSGEDSMDDLRYILRDRCLELVNSLFDSRSAEFLNTILVEKSVPDRKISKDIIDRGSVISKMALAYASKDKTILEELRKKNPKDWYILFGIGNNENTHPSTLYRLVAPVTKDKAELTELYTSFAWRNMYLYIAKNSATNNFVRNHIVKYKFARPMDIEAARKEKRNSSAKIL